AEGPASLLGMHERVGRGTGSVLQCLVGSNPMGYKVAFLATMTVFAGSASAVTFSFVTIQAPPLSTGSSYQANGNSISFFLPNAIVGDAVAPLRAGNLTIECDADTPAPALGAEVGINLGVALSGSGSVFFNERIFELDNIGNEIGLIG